MELKSKLSNIGWHLSQEWLEELLQENPNITLEAVINKALNQDFRIIGDKVLPEDIGKANDKLEGPLVLQIHKIRNVKTSKANASNKGVPTLLRVFLTDGHVYCSGLQQGSLTKIKATVQPGSKLLLLPGRRLEARGGFLLISDSDIKFLGGSVEEMVEKVDQEKKNASNHGPPLWVEFGKEIDMSLANKSQGLRCLELVAESEKPRENEAFDQLRESRIQEANSKKKGPKKFYPSSSKQKSDSSQQHQPPRAPSPTHVPKYTQPKSEPPPPPPPTTTKLYNTDLVEAMQDLRMDNPPPLSRPTNNRRGKGQGRRRGRDDESEISSRPTKGSTLFDFLESHLPPSKEKPENPPSQQNSQATTSSRGPVSQSFDYNSRREDNHGGSTGPQHSRGAKNSFSHSHSDYRQPAHRQPPPPSRPDFHSMEVQPPRLSHSFHSFPTQPPFQMGRRTPGGGDFKRQRGGQSFKPPPDDSFNGSCPPLNDVPLSWADCEFEQKQPSTSWTERKQQPQMFTSMEFRSRRGGGNRR